MFEGGFSVPSTRPLCRAWIGFRERQRLGRRAQRAHLGVEHLGILDAHAQAAEIGRRVQRAVGRHHLEAVVPVARPVMPFGSSFFSRPRPIWPFGHRIQRGLGRENIRQVEGLEFLHAERAELGQRRRQHLHRAQLQGFQLFLVLVQLAVRVDFHLDPPARQLFGQHLEAFGGLPFRRVGRDHVAELDDDGGLGPDRAAGGQAEREGQDRGADGHIRLSANSVYIRESAALASRRPLGKTTMPARQ
jgi:hypothetical protein